MKPHTKIYMKYFDYGMEDVIICEHCKNKRAVDVHHIDNKKMGGSKTKDYIENLIGLCRKCHEMAHNNELSKGMLTLIHRYTMVGK
uniref:HNH endonuclease n=1 Tax=uncultured marine virus TaxID=186617 RepID=A0A0F7L8Y2_9VIRU|nr:HNH endonuclease [uncultured marine virus]